MEKSPSGAPSSALVQSTSPVQHRSTNMSTLAIPPLPAFPRDHHWDALRSAPPSLPRLDTNNSLPSIRELVPAHLLTAQPQDAAPPRRSAPLTSPASLTPGLQPSPGYVHTPQGGQKRRRLSVEEDQDDSRARQVPRLYQPSEAAGYTRRDSPPSASRPDGHFGDSRPASSDKYQHPSDSKDRGEPRSLVPSLPPPQRSMERDPRSPYRSEVAHEAYHSRVPPPPPSSHGRNASLEQHTAPYRANGATDYGYSSYHPSSRYASAPSSANPYERTPFTTPPYASQYQDYGRFGGDLSHGGLVGETKQRKRRGNLPKETTDKLRAWFVSHLQHPYPTEDEKQDLMRQTGLQMNQISNWFINARRRQLPNMINDAKAESDAMSGRSLQSRSDSNGYSERVSRGDHLNLSDGEGRLYEDDLRMRRSHRDSI